MGSIKFKCRHCVLPGDMCLVNTLITYNRLLFQHHVLVLDRKHTRPAAV